MRNGILKTNRTTWCPYIETQLQSKGGGRKQSAEDFVSRVEKLTCMQNNSYDNSFALSVEIFCACNEGTSCSFFTNSPQKLPVGKVKLLFHLFVVLHVTLRLHAVLVFFDFKKIG